jgi:hypothetical protein
MTSGKTYSPSPTQPTACTPQKKNQLLVYVIALDAHLVAKLLVQASKLVALVNI